MTYDDIFGVALLAAGIIGLLTGDEGFAWWPMMVLGAGVAVFYVLVLIAALVS